MFSWLKKLFKKDAPREPETAEVLISPSYDVEVSVWTDVGCLREVNEDCGRYVTPGHPELVMSKGVLAFVADGMGGHVGGEIASRIVGDELGRFYYEASAKDPHEALRTAIEEVNRVIYQASLDDVALQGMGTTCTALVLRGDEAFSGHIGDSRLYLARDEHIERLSEDHSLVNEMVKQGLISEEQARTHEHRNVITRALGLHPVVEVATWEAPLPVRPHDRFVLCSDGLYDLVSDEEMKDLVVSETPYVAGERLVALAKERGGHDNITVAVLWLKPLEPTTPTPERDTREVEIAS